MAKRRRFGAIVSRPRSRNYYVRFWLGTKLIERVGGPNKDIAARKLARIQILSADGVATSAILHEVFGDPLPHQRSIAFTAATAEFLVASEGRRRPSTIGSYRQIFSSVSTQPWASADLRDVQHTAIAAWVAQRMKSGVSGATMNRVLSALSALFRWAIREGYAETNPIARIQKFSEKGRERETYLTEGEVLALIASAPTDLRPLLTCALWTGMRKGELERLTWASVDLERRFLTVEPEVAKSGKARTIPFLGSLEELLRTLADQRGPGRMQEPVFLTQQGAPFDSWQLRKRLDRAVASCAAIPDYKKPKVTMHTIRHTAASIMATAGVPLLDISRILGHSTTAVTGRYAHFAPEAAVRAIEALDRRLRPQAYPPGVGEQQAEFAA